MYQLDLEELSRKVNYNYKKNGGVEEITYKMNCNWEQMLSVKVEASHKETLTDNIPVDIRRSARCRNRSAVCKH